MLGIRTEIYSRVSGYFRPTSQWNAGKREEFSERKFAHIKKEEFNGDRNKRSCNTISNPTC